MMGNILLPRYLIISPLPHDTYDYHYQCSGFRVVLHGIALNCRQMCWICQHYRDCNWWYTILLGCITFPQGRAGRFSCSLTCHYFLAGVLIVMHLLARVAAASPLLAASRVRFTRACGARYLPQVVELHLLRSCNYSTVPAFKICRWPQTWLLYTDERN